MSEEQAIKQNKGKVLSGRVVSNKMKDTAVVLVERYVKHPRYGKYVRRRKKIKVHDPGNTLEIGVMIEIRASRPISKDKSFIISKRSEGHGKESRGENNPNSLG